MRICEVDKCNNFVFGTDKLTRIGYCKQHQYKRTDIDKSSPTLKAYKKQLQAQKGNINSKVRSLIQSPSNIELSEKVGVKEPTDKQIFFLLVRPKMSGWCKCGCNLPSSKNDDANFRSSICHVFPQRDFSSIQFHLRNWVERAFWGGHHTNMDTQSMNKWVDFADWEEIKEIFHELAPMLTKEERSKKFYTHLENLVYYGNIEGKK